MTLRDDKWKDIIHLPKYEMMRTYLVDTFNELIFKEDTHQYFIHGNELKSVSNVTHMFKPKFDSKTKAIETAKRNFNNPRSKYYKMTSDQILESWNTIRDNACDSGTNVHEFGESCFWYMIGKQENIYPEFRGRLKDDGFHSESEKEDAVVKFWIDLPKCFIPIAVENKICREDLGYAGTFDMLFYYDAEIIGNSPDKSGFLIFDYKTNKDLYKNFGGETMLFPFSNMLNNPLNGYKLQLSLYQLALEPVGYKVIGRRIIWLHENGDYEKISTESYSNILENQLIKNGKEHLYNYSSNS